MSTFSQATVTANPFAARLDAAVQAAANLSAATARGDIAAATEAAGWAGLHMAVAVAQGCTSEDIAAARAVYAKATR